MLKLKEKTKKPETPHPPPPKKRRNQKEKNHNCGKKEKQKEQIRRKEKTERTNNLPKGTTGHSGNEDPQGRNDSDLSRFNFFKQNLKLGYLVVFKHRQQWRGLLLDVTHIKILVNKLEYLTAQYPNIFLHRIPTEIVVLGFKKL